LIPGRKINTGNCWGSGAFTIAEVLAATFIISILIALFVAGYGPILARAESAGCLTHMRSLHTSLSTYIQDRGMWPQEPEDSSGDRPLNEEWWLNELSTYGTTPDVWLCPTIKRLSAGIKDPETPRIHLLPQSFDELPSSPYKYSTQPWLIEIAGMHGHGANICFPDGSIRPMDDLLKK
jgi:prepilin-type processing-associated H-X9-DG protein